MTRSVKRTTTVVEEPEVLDDRTELPHGAVPDLPRELTAEVLPTDLLDLVEALGPAITSVRVFRRADDGEEAYVGKFTATAFDFDAVKRDYGGGRYTAHVIYQAEGEPQQTEKRGFAVDGPAKIAAAEEKSDRYDRLIELLVTRPAGPQIDPVAIATALATASSSSLQAAMQMFAPLLAAKEKGGTDLEGAMSLVEFVLDRASGKNETDGWDVARDVGLRLAAALEQGAVAQTIATRRRPAAAAVGTAEVAPANAEAAWWAQFAQEAKRLVPYAGKREPADVASLVYLHAPPLARQIEARIAANPAAFKAQLVARVPEFASTNDWLDALLTEFLPDEEDDGKGEPGETEE